MKIRPEHLEYIQNAISGLDKELVAEHARVVRESGKYKDFAMRMRWDIFHSCIPSNWVCDNLYSYMDDTHLNSALKACMKTCGFPEYA